MDSFNINDQFEKYLKLVALDKLPKDSVQYQELKRAYVGAWGMALITFRNKLAVLSQKEGVATLRDLEKQVNDFWVKEEKNHSD